jgi:gluconolactonase
MSTKHLSGGLFILAAITVLAGCSTPEEPAAESASGIPVIEAELIASDGSWGNTEGPAIDSTGALYFTSRGTYRGIVRWTAAEGAAQYAPVASLAGPGGLWIDANDNIYLTATNERQVQRLAPDGTLTTVAEGFEADPAGTTGPNDVTVSSAGVVYFTDPKGYQGEAAPGTIYRVSAAGEVSVFDDTVVGPNGIILSLDERTLYVAQNSGTQTANLIRWPLDADGLAAGEKEIVATLEPCIGDGMAVDSNGNVWVTCYSTGTAHLIDVTTGETIERVTTEQQALTNCIFGKGDDRQSLYLSSSDMDRVTGYVYRATVTTPGP